MSNDKFNREHAIQLLVSVYDEEYEKMNLLSDEELKELSIEHQKKDIQIKRNPNNFFYIKGMPLPKEYNPKTSTRGGWILFISIIIVIIGATLTFLLLAFKSQGMI
ncbi:hypothetical protein [Mycoplasma elephantis]|uniref:hypothetical protein n=1 Tax=Mycoplasma elephantis TaxID=114882 RepID=UPI000484BF89|nr:hypothetical protein [Mycoplasma elephantis]